MAINKNVLAENQATVLAEDGNVMYATIQMRHGKESEMDKSKFVPAEMGVATDTKKAFMAFGSNQVKEMMFREDSEIEELLGEVREISDKAVEAVESAETTAKQTIQDFTDQMKATIPEDYTAISQDIIDLKSAIEDKGLSSIEKHFILTLFKNAAYVSDSMNGVITALENMFNKTGKLYEMTARTFDGTGSSVDTGIPLFSSDISFTITVDAEIDNIDDIDVWRLFSCMSSSSPWSGITVQSDGSVNTQLQWSTRKEAGKYIPSLDSGRVRVVLSHVEGSNKAIYYIKYNDDTMDTVTISSVMIPQDENLYIGGNKTNCCWKGEISSFILYDHVLSSEEINTFMS